jgi:type I restriction enzyme S subunit
MEESGKYINTEFGRIPSDWRYCTFKDVLITFSSGATPYRAIGEYYKGKIRWISSGELNYNIIEDTLEHISEAAVKNTNLKIHEPGTFLMAITGLEAEGTRGRCAIIGAPSTTNQSCLALNGTGKMTTDYLFWFYRQYGNYLAFKYCQGTKQQSYTAAIVRKLPICCPKDPNEQTAIATALSDTDTLISALDKKIAKKQQIKQGAMRQLLTGKKRLPGFSGENRYKETEIGLIPEDWEIKSLGEISRNSSYGIGAAAINYNGEYKYIRITDIDDRSRKFIPSPLSSPSYYDESFIVEEGDILFARTGASVGKSYLYNKSDGILVFAGFLIRFNISDAIPEYVFFYTSQKDTMNGYYLSQQEQDNRE